MCTEQHVPRLLGAAFLVVVVTSLTGGLLLTSGVGSGSISALLVNSSQHLPLLRLSILCQLVTSGGIVVLAGLLYLVLHKQHQVLALVALGWWLAEAIMLALSQIGVLGLLPLSQAFVQAGAPDHAFYQTLGEFLYDGVANQGVTIQMLFYCLGGLVWYSLFFTARSIPRVISLWGVLAVAVALVGIVLQVLGYEVSMFVFLPILPFEITIGAWLVLKGLKDSSIPARGFDDPVEVLAASQPAAR